jgi:hypothetical protein
MRAVVDPKVLAGLDPLSRELIDNRKCLFEADIDNTLLSAASLAMS